MTRCWNWPSPSGQSHVTAPDKPDECKSLAPTNHRAWLAELFRPLQRPLRATRIKLPATVSHTRALSMCNFYSITTKREAIRALLVVINRYACNQPPLVAERVRCRPRRRLV